MSILVRSLGGYSVQCICRPVDLCIDLLPYISMYGLAIGYLLCNRSSSEPCSRLDRTGKGQTTLEMHSK